MEISKRRARKFSEEEVRQAMDLIGFEKAQGSVASSSNSNGTPLILFRSGYGWERAMLLVTRAGARQDGEKDYWKVRDFCDGKIIWIPKSKYSRKGCYATLQGVNPVIIIVSEKKPDWADFRIEGGEEMQRDVPSKNGCLAFPLVVILGAVLAWALVMTLVVNL